MRQLFRKRKETRVFVNEEMKAPGSCDILLILYINGKAETAPGSSEP